MENPRDVCLRVRQTAQTRAAHESSCFRGERLIAPFRYALSRFPQARTDSFKEICVRGPASYQRAVHKHPRRAELRCPKLGGGDRISDVDLLGLRAFRAGLDFSVVDACTLRAFLSGA